MLKKLIAICSLAGLCACAATTNAPAPAAPATVAPTPAAAIAAPPSDPLSKLASFTLADLQAASADAHQNNDVTAYQCYDYLIQVMPTISGFRPGTPIGAVLAFQKLRDLNNSLGGVQSKLKSLNLACAPLVIDTQTVINKLILLGAGGAATSGAALPLIPMLGATLP